MSIPLYFKPEQWIAHWKRIERPDDDAFARLAVADLVACGRTDRPERSAA